MSIGTKAKLGVR